jgi:membrane protein DedA with SNARE-associated domain
MWAMLLFGLHVHVHLFHHAGPAFDYVGIALASFASWVGIPGPGEALLLAAGVFAAKHKLDITPVVFVAFLGATAGGIAGWLVGLLGGRSLLTAPGPLRSIRQDAVDRGEETFKRMEVIAIILTPPWVAGIFHTRALLYNVVNVVSAAIWAVTIGVGGYYFGPPILELVNDFGTVGLVFAIVLVVAAVGTAAVRKHRGAVRRTTKREGAQP